MRVIKIGLAGTGFIAEGFAKVVQDLEDMEVVTVLTRREPGTVPDVFQKSHVTNRLDDFLQNIDCVVECSGDPIYGTETVEAAFKQELPVITMNSELQLLTGSWLADQGVLSEADGDQPGAEAAVAEDARAMGFTPVLYGNIKGFLNHNPTEEDMQFWAAKQGISITQVTAFTDGTKIQIEQALVANALGARLTQPGMRGVAADSLKEGVAALLEGVAEKDLPITDYILSRNLPAGVFVVATHNDNQKDALKYLKMGDGPYYTFLRPFHLCHFEIPKTIRRIMAGQDVLMNNGPNPTAQVYSIAKHDMKTGDYIKRATGSFDVRGEAMSIADNPDCVPIGLLAEAKVKKAITTGKVITFDDVELPDSRALFAWRQIVQKVHES